MNHPTTDVSDDPTPTWDTMARFVALQRKEALDEYHQSGDRELLARATAFLDVNHWLHAHGVKVYGGESGDAVPNFLSAERTMPTGADAEPPLGQTTYLNYDPDEIDSIGDAVRLFEWLAEQNDGEAAAVYDDAATFLSDNYE